MMLSPSRRRTSPVDQTSQQRVSEAGASSGWTIHSLAIECVAVSMNGSDQAIRVVRVANRSPQVGDDPREIPFRHKRLRPERGVQFGLRQRS